MSAPDASSIGRVNGRHARRALPGAGDVGTLPRFTAAGPAPVQGPLRVDGGYRAAQETHPMSDSTTVLYEGLFLLNNQQIAGDLTAALDTVREMLDRAEAEVVSIRKWDEGRLAYPIEGQKRGLYVLSLFKVRPTQIANIERDCNLSESVLRAMMVRGDHYGETELAEEVEAAKTTAAEAKLKAEEAAAKAAEAPAEPKADAAPVAVGAADAEDQTEETKS